MAFPMNTKTVFILDHGSWMGESCGIQMEIEGGNGGPSSASRGRGSYYASFIPPVSKSLWTCSVESMLEYARVVLDLFPNDRLLRFLICAGQSNQPLLWLNDWEASSGVHGQSNVAGAIGFSALSEKFANIGSPPKEKAHSHQHMSNINSLSLSIQAAIEALGQPTPSQISFMRNQSGYSKSSIKAINKGRIVCISTITSSTTGNTPAEDLIDVIANVVTQHNRMVAPSSDHLLPILECEITILSIHPLGKLKYSSIAPRPMYELSPSVSCEVIVVEADKICPSLIDLCVQHHELVSTTITGIPMKEEQNAQSSSNYDVPLWHHRMPASALDCSLLKWSSPTAPKSTVGAGAGGLIHHCTAACRVTPVDVNSRPSTCLSSFLIGGRSVWLELVNKKGKSVSHMLTAHGGDMWMHVVETARNVLEDPPSISEGIGGRVTDYRIPDFADLMRMNVLIPYPKTYEVQKFPKDRDERKHSRKRSYSTEDNKKPIELAKERLYKKTTYWPMTIGGSLLFSMAVHIESLLKVMPQDTMTESEKAMCNQCIWNLMTVEARGEAAVPTGHHKKGHKRDEQWRAVYAELEVFIRANQHSENHKKVLEVFLESRRMESKVDSRSNEERFSKLKDSALEKALEELTEATSENVSTTDSPMSPPPPSEAPKRKKNLPDASSTRANLLSLWTTKTEKKDFRELSNVKLYAHLNPNDKAESSKS